MILIRNLEWRTAVKKFNPIKKVSPEELDLLLRAVQLAPSSGGLQPYRILLIEDEKIRAELCAKAYEQSQIVDCTALMVFAVETKIDPALVGRYIDLIAEVRRIERSSLEGFEQAINSGIGTRNLEDNIVWANKQAYIALGVLIAAAADLRVDVCPMEGFNTAGFDQVLGLKELGLTTSVIAAIGHRSHTDVYSNLAKVRKPADELFIRL